MTSSEYEQYVTKIVRQFGFCKHAKISNNRRFQGKRQPGEYEIDIAVEVRFSEALYFLMIIECKYWNRPVDRPVIQALAQTRDALSAHKAVVATVQGFSKEAISVAEAHGIALWRVDPEFDGELLKSVASDNREVFRSLIKYRKTPFSMDWSVFPDFYHLDLR